jgi:RNA ligase
MKYEFPHITNISQVLPVIEGKPEFIVAVKEGDYTVINYVVQMSDTFPPVETHGGSAKMRVEATRAKAILRELRGIIFRTSTGEVLARRLHKFFNVNEKDETQINKIDFNEPHVILEKLDGSMITPLLTDAGLRWGTKMGVTDVALPVEDFVKANPHYTHYANVCIAADYTPIFEWCSRKQTIVIDHPVDRLVLIALRHNKTGLYESYDRMKQSLAQFAIPIVEAYEGTLENMQALIDYTRDLVGTEGFVVRFDSGHMLKVKAEDYVRKHKAKDMIGREKNVIEIIVNEKADDVKGFLDAKDLARFEEFERKFWVGVKIAAENFDRVYSMRDPKANAKDFAVNFVQKMDPSMHRFMYSMNAGASAFSLVKDTIANNCSTQTKVEAVRWLFGAHWNEQNIEE